MPETSLSLTADAVPLQCRHIRPDGRRCGSPALRTRHFCYHHDLSRRSGPRQPQVTSARAAKANNFSLPTPADLSERTGLQLALGQILHKIANNEIDPRRAGLLLYGLQIASGLLPPRRAKHDPKPEHENLVEEVVEDPELGTVAPSTEWAEAEEPLTPGGRILLRWQQEMEAESAADEAARKNTAAAQQASRNGFGTPAHGYPAQAAPAYPEPLPSLEACRRPNRAQRRLAHRQRAQEACIPHTGGRRCHAPRKASKPLL